MNISPKERFLDICHFKRPGDLWLRDPFWGETLEEWVKQGAPKEIIHPRFRREYFQHQRIYRLGGTEWRGIIGEDREAEEITPQIDLGHGITVEAEEAPRKLVPAYEIRAISEDERTITYINASGQTVKYIKDSLENMPMYLD